MGVWISPFAVRLLAVMTLFFTVVVLSRVADGFYKIHPGNWTGFLSLAFGCSAVTALLRAGRREQAR